MIVSLIVAMDRNGLIGRENRLPWHLPRDLSRFRRLTWGKPILMGRRTFESLGRPLEGRRNIVLSRREDYRPEGCEVAGSLAAGIALAEADAHGDPGNEVMIIGGAAIFQEALAFADRVYLTTVEGEFQGDTYFPLKDRIGQDFIRVEESDHPSDMKNPHPHTFSVHERRRPS